MTNKNAKYIVYNRDIYKEGKKFYIYSLIGKTFC